MKGIETVEELEKKFGVKIGDLVMCTFNSSPWDILDMAIGIYNPYQGVDGERLGPSDVDLSHGATQRSDLKKSNSCFRVHLLVHGYGDKSKMWNGDGNQVQIPVNEVIDFRIEAKSKKVTEFYLNSINKSF